MSMIIVKISSDVTLKAFLTSTAAGIGQSRDKVTSLFKLFKMSHLLIMKTVITIMIIMASNQGERSQGKDDFSNCHKHKLGYLIIISFCHYYQWWSWWSWWSRSLWVWGRHSSILPYRGKNWGKNYDYKRVFVNTNDQLTNYLEKLGYFSNPPKKSSSNFFWVAQDLFLVQLILIMQKITKKSLFGHFLGYPPKMHYSALQCSAMYWSANAWIIHSRWVK